MTSWRTPVLDGEPACRARSMLTHSSEALLPICRMPTRARIVVETLPNASGDHTMIRRIFANLIGNALKFSAERESPIIEIGTGVEGGALVFHVKDNSVEFDMKYAGELFGMFQRLHRETEFSGTGTGLALVKRLIERQGVDLGSISAR